METFDETRGARSTRKHRLPVKVSVTQEGVAAADGHHRTTFNGKYHEPLRLRIKELRKRAKDPKGAHVRLADNITAARQPSKSKEDLRPRYNALMEENEKLKLELRLMRREQFEQKREKRVSPEVS
jgi:hypothetical protein